MDIRPCLISRSETGPDKHIIFGTQQVAREVGAIAEMKFHWHWDWWESFKQRHFQKAA